MRFSVVIPTYNRVKILEDCLQALMKQRFPPESFEIVVVDDGSTDETPAFLAKFKKNARVEIRTFAQENSGQAVARNVGIREARGEIILFLGDDIIATPELLREHDRLHKTKFEENAAVLGFITWHPKLTVTPLMRFMERGGAVLGRFGGQQFAYDLLEGKETADWRFFYTANISLKRSLLNTFKFDPWFSGYGWEDIELGLRLTKKAGLTLYYAPDAIGYHDHAMNFDQWRARMQQIGEAAHRIHKRYPELSVFPSDKKRAIFKLLSNPLLLKMIRPLWPNLYLYGLSKKYFLQGLAKGYNRDND